MEGKNVYAAAEGYVYRIKIQEYGYGKVLYIRHPNGYSTTYAHLKEFSPTIEAYVKKKQYEKESYTIELYPSPNELKVEKGDIIALSGNTGGSGGPHLHFEIRDVKNDHALNPLLFNLPVKDEIAPTIYGIKIYPLSPDAYLGSKPKPQYFRARGANGVYQLNFQDTIRVHGKIGIGIDLNDFLNGSHNKCGIYSIELKVGDTLIHQQVMDCIPFDKSRFINAHTDFEAKKNDNKWIQKCYVEPYNELPIYEVSIGQGIVSFYEEKEIPVEIIVKDSYKNESRIQFQLKSKRNAIEFQPEPKEFVVDTFDIEKANHFEANNVKIDFPAYSFYNPINFEYRVKSNDGKAYSDYHVVHKEDVPCHQHFTIQIKPDSIPKGKEHQLIMASLSPYGHFISEGGSFNGEYVQAKSRTFGTFFVYLDSLPPIVRPLNITEGKNISRQSSIRFRIEDNFSGINSYKALVDGKWILMEYDYKKKLLFHNLDDKIGPGKHQLVLTVLDGKGNKTTYTVNFER